MNKGGTLMTVSFYGAEKAVDHYNIMGPVKAALEATVRYSAKELGERGILFMRFHQALWQRVQPAV